MCGRKVEATHFLHTGTKNWGLTLALTRHIWGSRWVDWAEFKGNCFGGWIIIFWGEILWTCTDVQLCSYSIPTMLEGVQVTTNWYFTGVISHTPTEKSQVVGWNVCNQRFMEWSLGDRRGFQLWRFEHERFNCIRRSSAVRSFLDFIQDMGLSDLSR